MSVEFSDEKFLNITESMFKEKSKGNDHFKVGQYDLATECYRNAIDLAKDFMKNLNLSEDQINSLDNNTYIQKFFSDLKFCYSNLAAVCIKQDRNQECIEIDKHILENLDPKFEKSLVRLIIVYKKLNDAENANKYYKLITDSFPEETIEKIKANIVLEQERINHRANHKETFKEEKEDKERLLSPKRKRKDEFKKSINKEESKEQGKSNFTTASSSSTNNINRREKIENPYLRKIISFVLALVLYFLAKKFIIDAFWGSSDKSIMKGSNNNSSISINKSETL